MSRLSQNYFPVERDTIKIDSQAGRSAEMKNPFHFINKVEHEVGSPELDAKYSLVWELELSKMPPGHFWLPSTSGIKVSLKVKDAANSTAKELFLSAAHVRDVFDGEAITKKVVRVPIELIEQSNFFNVNPLALENPEEVEFLFRAVTSNDVVTQPGSEKSLSMTPLYNLKRVGCAVYNGSSRKKDPHGYVSMYGLWRVFKIVREMKNNITGLFCNDLSLPFGGDFSPFHTGIGHMEGYAIDVGYLGGDKELDLYSGTRFTLAEEVVIGRINANRKYADWVLKLRENVVLLANLYPQVRIVYSDGRFYPERGTSIPNVIPLGVSWNESLFISGVLFEIPLVGSTDIPINEFLDAGEFEKEKNLARTDDRSHLGHLHLEFLK